MMSLFCGFLPGICGGISFLTFSVLLSGADVGVFALYALTGLLGACLFSRLDEKYRIALPLFVSLSFLFAAETACVVLFANETLKWELFLIPALNVIISLILLLILLKVYSGMEIFKYRIKYLEINDQEFELLVNIKEKDKNAYYRAVHAAYFSERIAQALSLDADAAKTAAYYANAGILYKEPEKDLEDAFVSYGFPPYARQLLRELTGKNTGIRHKEAAVVYMADAVISSILYLFEKKQDTKTDYAAVIETVFQKKWESGSLKNSELTFAEWNRMKKSLRRKNYIMTSYVENETEITFPFAEKEILDKVADAVLLQEGCPYEAQVNLLITDNEGIRTYNASYRQIDRATDVLSFPNLDFETPADFSHLEEHEADYFDPESGELLLGDIILSADKVKEQAESYGHSELREFAFLIAHSMLHLCGYDHMEPEEAKVMEAKQEEVLAGLHITREER